MDINQEKAFPSSGNTDLHPAQRQFNYHEWANRRVITSILELPAEEHRRRIQSTFASLSEAIIHMYAIDARWLSVLSGASFEESGGLLMKLTDESKEMPLEEVWARYNGIYERYHVFLKEADLDALFELAHPQFGVFHIKLSEVIQHVVNHGTYHRGNLSSMLRQLGNKSVPTDYMFYLFAESRQ
ncbi:DinB family protein [Paenibacillus sp. FJAT-26967]|uniref:DinB family protein n=1 Tax=Paenibacillus sp. FJAT-26967 TaxID=1729690 RepID=UPI00083976C3|nr:DinB family protein [Paenibacillus sp. FJAT-26967]